jgi:hypothetical protein
MTNSLKFNRLSFGKANPICKQKLPRCEGVEANDSSTLRGVECFPASAGQGDSPDRDEALTVQAASLLSGDRRLRESPVPASSAKSRRPR